MQPEVTVETTTYNGSDSDGRSTPTKTAHAGAITTKVSLFTKEKREKVKQK